jgi:hypothetical protein
MELIYIISIWLLPILVAITFHEAAHGYVARFLGDETASRLGRVSLNPLRHIDPFGTILLPGLLLLARSPFLFGYAKPVPVNFGALRNPRIGMVLVAAAGPAMNIGLAIVAALSFHLIVYLPVVGAQWAALNVKNALKQLLLEAFAPYGEGRLAAFGPEISIGPDPARHLILLIHELVTNAVKYGSLSQLSGRVFVNWQEAGDTIVLNWKESGGPRIDSPKREGFGSQLMTACIKALSGSIQRDFASDGLACSISFKSSK